MGINRIATNVSALTAQRNLNQTGNNLQKSIERLSSGLRINRAGDDAAGLSVANRLRTQSQGLNVAVANAQDGINVISVAEGALEETTSRLNRIRELAIQAANTGVNDIGARNALQDEVFQSIDEITRIANTTQFSSNNLLNGDFSIQSGLKAGVQNVGLSIDASPVASNLGGGTSFLNIKKVEEGFKQITAGDPTGSAQTLNTGIVNQNDQAVSLAFFSETVQGIVGSANGVDAAADTLDGSFFNGVSIANSRLDVITFEGVLADGVTRFNGSQSVTGAADFTALLSSITRSITASERALFGGIGNVPTSFQTTVSIGLTGANQGRILLNNSQNTFSEASISFSLVSGGNVVSQSNGVTRSGAIGANSVIGGQGAIGNAVDAITGSTFGDGSFTVSVEDVQTAQQRTVESTIQFRDQNGTIIDRTLTLAGSSNNNTLILNGSFVSGVFTGGTTLAVGDTVSLTGTSSDGNTFTSTFTLTTDTTADAATNDFLFGSVSGLVFELNARTRLYAAGTATNGDQTRFEDAIFTYSSSGQFQLLDDVGKSDSQTEFTFRFDAANGNGAGSPLTIQDDAVLTQEGFAESATFRIDGGPAVRAEAGDVVTLFGEDSTIEGVPTPQVTVRIGSGLTAGTDTYENNRDVFTGALNGGARVTFQQGDQDVVFLSDNSNAEPAKFVTVDFDNTIDVTSTFDADDTGFTVLISTVNTGLNFQIGAGAGQNIQFALGDLRADNLGFGRGSGRSVNDINISTLEGANEAIRIVDEALDQVNRTRSILGAATNRLESTVANLSVASENLTASESRIRDADIAAETTKFTLNQVLLQAGTSVLAQANFQSQGFLQLLG